MGDSRRVKQGTRLTYPSKTVLHLIRVMGSRHILSLLSRVLLTTTTTEHGLWAQVPLIPRGSVLEGIDALLCQRVVLCCDDFDKVLEHVLRLMGARRCAAERVDDIQTLLC